MPKRDKTWWANLSPAERSELVGHERWFAMKEIPTDCFDLVRGWMERTEALIRKANGETDAN